jgi:rhodanese-related sulfurtransferase
MRARPAFAAAAIGLVGVLGLTGCATETAVAEPAAAAMTTIGADDLVEVAETTDAVVLDVRTPAEYAEGHVPGALNIDVTSPTFAAEIAALPSDVAYVVYCRSGNRSAQAAQMMVNAGFTEVYDVDAGLATLAEAGVVLTQ